MDNEQNADIEILLEFIDESLESLGHVSGFMDEMDCVEDPIEMVQEVFRVFHSIKGSAPYFGLMNVKKLAHSIENVLDKVRNGVIIVDSDFKNLLLEGADALIGMLENYRENSQELQDNDGFNVLVDKIDKASEQQKSSAAFDKIDKIIDNIKNNDDIAGISYVNKKLDEIKKLLATQRNDTIFPKLEPQKSSDITKMTQLLKVKGDSRIAAKEESEIGEILTRLELSIMEEGYELYSEIKSDYETAMSTIGLEGLMREILLEKVGRLSPYIKESVTSVNDVKKEKSASGSSSYGKKEEPNRTMRVRESSIDNFLAYVGELIVVEGMYKELHNRLIDETENSSLIKSFRSVNSTMSELSKNLRNAIMEVRKMSVRTLMQRASSIVRKISRDSGKKIDVNLIGADILIDKSLIETLEAPLVHMVRNSADHGIEAVEERILRGKSGTGTITIELSEDKENIALSVKDDGNGLDLEKLHGKAVDLGLISNTESLSNEAIMDLMFQPGVSTASEVTDISGRGVGMDVVKNNIEKIGGKISVETEYKIGSTFTIRLPKNVSTQIVSGFIVRDNYNNFVIPTDMIHTSEIIKPESITTTFGKNRMIKIKDNQYALYSLKELFNKVPSAVLREDLSDKIAILVNVNHKKYAIIFDEILSMEQLVLKEIAWPDKRPNGIAGGVLTGDGSIAIVLDLNELIPS